MRFYKVQTRNEYLLDKREIYKKNSFKKNIAKCNQFFVDAVNLYFLIKTCIKIHFQLAILVVLQLLFIYKFKSFEDLQLHLYENNI